MIVNADRMRCLFLYNLIFGCLKWTEEEGKTGHGKHMIEFESLMKGRKGVE